MKRIIPVLLFILMIFAGLVIIKRYLYIDNKNIKLENNEISSALVHKGLKGASDFTTDDNGNYYIAYDRCIQFISRNGMSFDILKGCDSSITSIEYYKGNLYIALGSEIVEFNPRTKNKKILMNNIPNFGDYGRSIIRAQNDCLYITIGTATNSGVCGSDNNWIKLKPYVFDISPKDITLRGLSFGDEKTGAFVPYKTKNISGQVISGHFPGNGSLIIYYLNDGFSKNYAWGIRNITGMDFTNSGKVIASVGGMEDRGLRPIKGDTDYIYEIKRDTWYGWPDYSGGDPITSPKFKGKTGALSFILDNHVSTNPPAPLYQHNSVGTIREIAVDREGWLGDINNIYFYDHAKNEILYIGKSVVPLPYVKLAGTSFEITSMKFTDNSLMFLDRKNGSLYKVYRADNSNAYGNNKSIIYYLLGTIVLGIIVTININKASEKK